MISSRRDVILGTLALACAPRVATAEVTEFGGMAFGSTWRLVSGPSASAQVRSTITTRIARIDAVMSPYRPNSALSQFNRSEAGQWIQIPPDLAEVAQTAMLMADDTGWAFDPTTGPLVHRFGFGPITGQATGPDTISIRGDTMAKTALGATLDLCGIAKGFALDQLTEDLIAQGATDFLLELGGEVRAIGSHPSGRPWHVAIEDPLSPVVAARHVVAPGHFALATSGHAANGLLRGPIISHVIDPRTARPAERFAASVSVLAETGIEADAIATALLAMGPDGPRFAEANNLSALFIPASGGASILTGGFQDVTLV